jgi:hypothetical protein
MLNLEAQTEALQIVAAAAKKHGLVVAPVGSVYFLFTERKHLTTKDIDVVVHVDADTIAPLELLEKMGRELGVAVSSGDKATVTVTVESKYGPVRIDLIRGKEGARRSFLPRELLRTAARYGRRDGSILWYPIEFVILFKADAAVDRAKRARSGGPKAAENLRRADVFRQDVFAHVQSSLEGDGLNERYLIEGLSHLKQVRRNEVASLLEAASGGRLTLSVGTD